MPRTVKPKPLACTPDFARSCPDRDSMHSFGLLSELMSAVDILSARQNQYTSSNDTKSTIQVLKAAQSPTLLFVRKSVDEPEEEVGKPRDLRYFDEDSACSVFFRHSTCYDVLPESGKLLVLDSTLPIRRAMQALIDHSLSAAPVWCSRLQCYTQLLTTNLCLRLLAQVFPLNPTRTSASDIDSSEGDAVAKTSTDPSDSMGYWESKTLGSVLKTFFNWAHSECPQEAVPETVTILTPQDHLYRATRVLTLATPASTSNEMTVTKTSMVNMVPPPRYIVIADQYGGGNLLGLLNSDRLLAYLRVRMRNLPTPSALKVNVEDLPGIRWEERGWQLADSVDFDDGDGEFAQSEDRRPQRRRIHSTRGSSFYLQPTTTCHEALHILTAAWNEAGLSCLPVATENGTGFQGMLTKHDILDTIFAGPLDIALDATIATIMSVRPRAAGCTNQAMCFTSECLVAVLDRMFRQKASCFVVFEKPGSGASWNGQAALGPAVGVITTTDFLQAIVIDAPLSASCIDVPEDVFFPKTLQLKGRYPSKSGGSKRYSLPVDQAVLNSVPGVQVGGNHQHGLTKIFQRTKRSSESEESPSRSPVVATASNNPGNGNGESNQPQSHQPGKSTSPSTNQQQQQPHATDDGTLFEMDDECA
ncbi:hypothetical protein Aperf_G00000105214 [Anoplocephala perfoliata]